MDNGSRDGTQELLRTHPLGVRCIRNAENLGFGVACNQGASEARSDYLLFLNNDTIALPRWLEPLINAVEGDAAVAMVGSRLLYADGTLQHAGVVMSRLFRTPYHIYRGVEGDHPAVNYAREFRAITGACMLVRRSIFETLGGFDTGFRNGYEDIDLCLKVGLRRHRILYEPKSTLPLPPLVVADFPSALLLPLPPAPPFPVQIRLKGRYQERCLVSSNHPRPVEAGLTAWDERLPAPLDLFPGPLSP